MNQTLATRSPRAAPWKEASRGLGRVLASSSVTARAFVASRLIVILAGAIGVLTASQRPRAIFNSAGMSPHLGTVGNVIFGPAVRWDAFFYVAIADHGYSAPGAPAFFPLYPTLMHALGWVVGSTAGAGVAISFASFALALVLLGRLTELELGADAARSTVLLLAFAPLSFFFTAVYAESLFLLLAVATLLAARRERWALAGVLAGLAAVTRVTGVLLFVPILIMLWRSRRRLDRQVGWVLLPLATLASYMAYLAANGYGWLAPGRAEATVWHRVTVGPLWTIASAVVSAVRGLSAIVRGAEPIYRPAAFGPFTTSAENVILLGVLALTLLALVGCLRRLPLEYGCLAALALAVSLSSPVIGEPLAAFDRYALTIFPLWMAAGAWIAERRLTRPAVLVGGVLLAFYAFWFSSWSFIA